MTALAPALQARALKVRLGDRQVLGGLSLALPAGRWTAIVGPNGAGKSTLLRALAGMESGAGVQGAGAARAGNRCGRRPRPAAGGAAGLGQVHAGPALCRPAAAHER